MNQIVKTERCCLPDWDAQQLIFFTIAKSFASKHSLFTQPTPPTPHVIITGTSCHQLNPKVLNNGDSVLATGLQRAKHAPNWFKAKSLLASITREFPRRGKIKLGTKPNILLA